MSRKSIAAARIALGMALSFMFAGRANAQNVNLVPISTGLTGPVGITSYGPTNQLLVSVNYYWGLPWNFELISANGAHAQFTSVTGLPREIKLATVEQPCDGPAPGGFTAGDVFYGVSAMNQIYRIPAGTDKPVVFATLPAVESGMDLYPYVDTAGSFGGDLIVGSASGSIYRINSGGVVTRIANLLADTTGDDVLFEGLTTIPNDPAKYGPWAGKLVVCGERYSVFYVVDTAGKITKYDLGIVTPEDIRVIPARKNLYIAGYDNGTISGVAAADFTGMVGDILVGQEWGGRLYRIHWNGTQFVATPITSAGCQFEQMTFSSAGLGSIPEVPFELTASVAKTSLWPPNHDLVDVGLAAHACPDYGTGYAVTVYSNEADINAGSGDDHFSPDAKGSVGTLRLRAEREGSGAGRVYVIVVTATSSRGQKASQVMTVVVPHSQSAADIAGVKALAAQALTQQTAFINAAVGPASIPTGYFLVGGGPVIGPKQ